MSEVNNVSIAPTSRALGNNPKDLLGAKKPDASKIPAVAIAWESLAMMDGAGKYDPYNWRANKVVASIYVAAAKRHLDLWFEGQRQLSEAGVTIEGRTKWPRGGVSVYFRDPDGHLLELATPGLWPGY
jgi:catechol 2,3-dioxygenase-like lactoylglutathione lyase family enzyme